MAVKDLIVLSIFYLAGIILMYVGYFNAYSEIVFFFYLLAILAYGACYVVYYGLIAQPQKAVYNWLFMFMLFPKKELRPDMPSLLNAGLGFSNVGLSMYSVLDVFFVLAMALVVASSKGSKYQERVPPNVRFLYHTYLAMALVGLADGILVWQHLEILGEIAYDTMLMWFWPLVVGLVVFRASARFIHTREQVEKMLLIPVFAGVLFCIEFGLGKYTSWLPQESAHYLFSYRGAYRSVFQGGTLLTGQLLIMGAASALYFWLSKHSGFYGVLALLFAYLVLQTYDRGNFLALVLVVIVMVGNSSRLNKTLVAVFILILLSYAAVDHVFLAGQNIATLGNLLDVGKARVLYEGGYFDFSSFFDRIGASLRGMDVFLYSPFFGVGPGNLSISMSSTHIPTIVDNIISLERLNLESWAFYQYIAAGHGYIPGIYVTDSHNLYVRMLAEYGMVAVVVIYATVRALFSTFLAFRRESRKERVEPERYSLYLIRLLGYSAIFAYGIYFMLQSQPLIYGLFFFLLRLTILNGDDWQQQPQIAGGIKQNRRNFVLSAVRRDSGVST